jgi:hypothetical protein
MWFCVGKCNEEEDVVHGISVGKLITKPSTTTSMNKKYVSVKLITG